MRWRGRRESDNVEDRRGQSPGGFRFPFPGRGRGRGLPGGFPAGLPRGRGTKISGLGLIIIIVLMLLFGVDPSQIFGTRQGNDPFSTQRTQRPQPSQLDRTQRPRTRGNDDLAKFVSVILADTEDTWSKIFAASNQRYTPPKLVLFSGAVNSACGFAQAAVGPFYCPGDRKVYVDLGFYRDLRDKFKAPGDFAQAYVIAHEIGHHIQTLTGISRRVLNFRRQASRRDGNAMQVRMELQADCFAGVWAHRAKQKGDFIESGDIEEGLRAASAIGDDRIQRRTRGFVVPDSFTHGTSAQRVRWFKRGLEQGKVSVCNTFEASGL